MGVNRAFAGKNLITNPAMHQIAESLLAAGVIALPQAMTGEADIDLALGVLGGLAVAAPGSLIAARGGKLIGRQIDRHMHAKPGRIEAVPQGLSTAYNAGMGMIPGSRQSLINLENLMDNPDVPDKLKQAAKPVYELNKARAQAEAIRGDGSTMHPYLNGAEHDLGTIGRRYGDNIAQLAVQLGIANALDGESEE